jgi:hypothetical protein
MATKFSMFGGRAMIESPLIQELLAERMHRAILHLLANRFGTLPPEISSLLKAIQDDEKLDDLNIWAWRCTNLEAFQSRLTS